jgi:hypothetical protein
MATSSPYPTTEVLSYQVPVPYLMRQLVRGKVYAVDGSGLGDSLRLVALVCVSATRPIIVA